MTYLGLLLVVLVAPILLLARRRTAAEPAWQARNGRQAAAIAALTALALTATVPWDPALLAVGAWTYPYGLLLYPSSACRSRSACSCCWFR